MVSKNTLFVPVVVVFVVGFEGSRKQQRERAGLSRCIPSCLDTVAVSSSTRPGSPSFSSSFLSSSLPKPVFLDLPSPRASLASRSFPSGIRSSSRGRVSLPLESPIGLVSCWASSEASRVQTTTLLEWYIITSNERCAAPRKFSCTLNLC